MTRRSLFRLVAAAVFLFGTSVRAETKNVILQGDVARGLSVRISVVNHFLGCKESEDPEQIYESPSDGGRYRTFVNLTPFDPAGCGAHQGSKIKLVISHVHSERGPVVEDAVVFLVPQPGRKADGVLIADQFTGARSAGDQGVSCRLGPFEIKQRAGIAYDPEQVKTTPLLCAFVDIMIWPRSTLYTRELELAYGDLAPTESYTFNFRAL